MLQYWVYIMGSEHDKAVYIGVTNDLRRRVQEHKADIIEGFTKQYRCHKLLYFEQYNEITDAIAREKQLKGWLRAKKEALIATINPEREDLANCL